MSMSKRFKTIITAIMFSVMVAAVPASPPVMAATKECNSGFMGFPAWYRGLTDADCNVLSPNAAGGISKFIWHIALNVIEVALVAAAYIAGGYILYGGFLFIISRGKPEGAAKARQTMLDAVVGLIISMSCIAIVQFVIKGILG